MLKLDLSQNSPSTESTSTECSSGQYSPNPNSCEKFFICVNGHLVEQRCAAGLVWNQETSMCDWKFNVKCGSDKHDEGRESNRVVIVIFKSFRSQ